jgi:DNA-binding transcriptional LysR family regulator
MNLKRLAYFCELADIGSFTKAAGKIGIAQSALSISIKTLEQELGLKLINRSEKNAMLTSEGKILYASATKLLQQAKQVSLEIQEMKELTQGSIRLGVSAMMGSYYFPMVITKFKQDFPGINIIIVDQGTTTLERMLLNGELDLALVRADQEDNQLRYAGLIHEEVVVGINKNNPLANQTNITLAEFCEQPLVLFQEDYFLREAVSLFAKRNKLTLNIKVETNLIELQRSLVRNQVGITTCLAMILKEEKNISAISFSPKIKFTLGLAWKRSHYLSQASQKFISYLKEAKMIC